MGADGLSHHLKVFKGSLHLYDPRPNDPPGIVILGEDEILLFSYGGKPKMIGGIVLKQSSRPRGLKARIDLPFLLGQGMVIPILQGIETKTVSAKRPMKPLLCLLSQEGKIELPTKRLCLLLDVVQFLIKPLFDFFRDHMKGILCPPPKTKGLLSMA